MPQLDPTKILDITEVRAILLDLKHRMKKARNQRLNLIVFRLACCCGLRRGEICGLNLGDLVTTGERPCLRVRKEITKGKTITKRDGTKEVRRRGRIVPLWWDKGTLADLRDWIEFRKAMGTGPSDPLLVGLNPHRGTGKRMTGSKLGYRWKTCIKCLGEERQSQLSIHSGRHTFASLSLQAGHSLVAVRDALGHANISTTSVYLHAIDQAGLPDVFGEMPKKKFPSTFGAVGRDRIEVNRRTQERAAREAAKEAERAARTAMEQPPAAG